MHRFVTFLRKKTLYRVLVIIKIGWQTFNLYIISYTQRSSSRFPLRVRIDRVDIPASSFVNSSSADAAPRTTGQTRLLTLIAARTLMETTKTTTTTFAWSCSQAQALFTALQIQRFQCHLGDSKVWTAVHDKKTSKHSMMSARPTTTGCHRVVTGSLKIQP